MGIRGFYSYTPSSRGLAGGHGEWNPHGMEAKCLRHYKAKLHAAPSLDCGCGLYGYNSFEGLAHGIYGPIWAVIQSWGRVLAHHDGFRAEYAKVAAILDNSFMNLENVENGRSIQSKDYPARIAQDLGIPLIPLKHRWEKNYVLDGVAVSGFREHGLRIWGVIPPCDLHKIIDFPDLSEYGKMIPPEMRPSPEDLTTDDDLLLRQIQNHYTRYITPPLPLPTNAANCPPWPYQPSPNWGTNPPPWPYQPSHFLGGHN